jgi:hypothetical protein
MCEEVYAYKNKLFFHKFKGVAAMWQIGTFFGAIFERKKI